MDKLEKRLEYLERRLLICEGALGIALDLIARELAHNMAREHIYAHIEHWDNRVKILQEKYEDSTTI